jgi:hypothetical protein
MVRNKVVMTEIYISKRQYHQLYQMRKWCNENIGERDFGGPRSVGGLWSVVTMFGDSTFSFVNDQDATAFALRWTQ